MSCDDPPSEGWRAHPWTCLNAGREDRERLASVFTLDHPKDDKNKPSLLWKMRHAESNDYSNVGTAGRGGDESVTADASKPQNGDKQRDNNFENETDSANSIRAMSYDSTDGKNTVMVSCPF
jgi:hypothetical protein